MIFGNSRDKGKDMGVLCGASLRLPNTPDFTPSPRRLQRTGNNKVGTQCSASLPVFLTRRRLFLLFAFFFFLLALLDDFGFGTLFNHGGLWSDDFLDLFLGRSCC